MTKLMKAMKIGEIGGDNRGILPPFIASPKISNRHYLPIRNALNSFPLFADTRSNRQ
jgi:hypothetical protein